MNTFTGFKKWFTSKTIWAGIIIVADAAYRAGAAQSYWPLFIPPTFEQMAMALAGTVAVHGRATATDKITK